MNLKIFITASFLAISAISVCQTNPGINKTDANGLKQGHWIKKYQNESIMYDGYFKNDHPVGEFKRYYDDNVLKSVLIYTPDGNEASATIYHPNGNIASRGRYNNQMKEGKWQFYSWEINGYRICEEYYLKNLKNGLSLKFYADSTIAERVSYNNDVRNGEWLQYYPNGKVCLKSGYLNGKVNGKFEVWFDNGKIEYSGQYKNDVRDGKWIICNNDGSIKYQVEYQMGVPDNNKMDIDESNYLDSLERNKGKIADPEKTGILK